MGERNAVGIPYPWEGVSPAMARLTSVREAIADNHLIGDHHLSCEQSAPFQPSASWGRAAVLFAIARQTQLTARSAIENPGMAEHERGRGLHRFSLRGTARCCLATGVIVAPHWM